MMLITAFLNTLSPGTITGGLTVALATRHRMQYMQKVRHKSRTFGVHYIDLRPNGQQIGFGFWGLTIIVEPREQTGNYVTWFYKSGDKLNKTKLWKSR